MANSSEKQAEAAKKKGNIYFKKEKLGAAIEAYTEAITLCPQVPIYWTNRALCERKRNEWEKVEADCRKALELDNKSVKGHYMLGLALLHYQQYGRAVAELEKALDLGRGDTAGTSYIVEEIWLELAKARYTEWEQNANARRQQLQDLHSFLQNLIKLDNQRRLKEITSVMTLNDHPAPEQLQNIGEIGETESVDGRVSYPNIEIGEDTCTDSAEDTNRESSCVAEDADGGVKRGGGRGRLYPQVYGHSEESDRTSEPTGEESGKSVEDEYRAQKSVSEDSERSTNKVQDVQKKESARFDPLNNRFSLQRRKSVQIRIQKLLRSAHFQHEEAAEGTNRFQPDAANSSGEEKSPYTIHDVYKVFKELVKLQQGQAGQELLRTTELFERRSKALNEVFEKVAAPDVPGEVPDHLCCKITMEIFRDPVMTPSGITYERAAIQEHIRKIGRFDPVTRAPLSPEQVYPNLAIRDAVQAYLAAHGWAYRT